MRKDQQRQIPTHRGRPAQKHTQATTERAVPLEPLLDLDELCQFLHLGKTKISELIHREGLPVHKFGTAYRFDRTEVWHWLQQRRHLM